MNELKFLLAQVICIEGMSSDDIASAIEIPPDPKLGDFSLPCFKFAKVLRMNPMRIAEMLKDKIEVLPPPFLSVTAVNGYLNFTVDKLSEARRVLALTEAQGTEYGACDEGKGKTICIDYSSINIAKPFHIGHLCTTVIGGSLYKIYQKLGYKCIGINHLGDWGTQFGKLIVAFKKWCSEEELNSRGMKVLTEIYVRYHKEVESNPEMDDEARAWFKKIEDGDADAIGLFNRFKEITLAEVQKTYARLKIEFDSYNGEAFYNDKMQPVLEKLTSKGLLTESQGAKIVDLTDYGMPPCLLVKADGATLYATRDLAAAYYRKNTYDFYKCLYVVAYQQNLHFKQWIKVMELLDEKWSADLVHVAFGMVSLEDGAMSTRTGNVVLLEDVLNKAVEKSLAIITEKSPDLSDKEEVAEMVGTGAVIFSVLYNNRIKDVVFSYDKVLNFDGETAPYVQYTAARCKSVLAKSGEYNPSDADFSGLDNEESGAVVMRISKFNDVLRESAEKYEPCVVARYLVDLCQAYNRFYLNNRIANEETGIRTSRAMLTNAVKNILCEGLRLLGISAPDKM